MRENPGKLADAISVLSEELKSRFPKLNNSKWIALRLLEGDQRVIDAITSGEFE